MKRNLKHNILQPQNNVEAWLEAATGANVSGPIIFPQGRLTDHRINLTLYKLEEILLGKLEQVIDPLLSHHQAEMLKAS